MPSVQLRDCDNCGKPTRNKRFCCRGCSAAVTNAEAPRRKRKNPLISCAHCGVGTYNKKYCSVDCSLLALHTISNARQQKMINEWLTGAVSGIGMEGVIKKHLIETRGNNCEECGWAKKNPITGRVTIQMDHVDGNWQNNSIDNLKLLCANCHTLTPTYGSLNTASMRKAMGLDPVVSRWDAGVRRKLEDYVQLHLNDAL